MRFILTLFGIITILLGLYPLLLAKNFIPEQFALIPPTGIVYQTIIVLVGLAALIIGIKSKKKPLIT